MSHHKLLLLTLICLFSVASASANNEPTKIKASLNEATVFFQGAELVHKTSASLTKGVNEVWITELSPQIDINSLKIKTTKGVIVASFEYSLDFINKKGVSSSEKVLKDSIKYYQNLVNEYLSMLKTNEDILELLKANKAIGGSETGLNVSELMKMVDYYSTKSNELNKAQIGLKEKIGKATDELGRISKQLEQESMKNTKSEGVLKLNLTSPMATTSDFTISYYTRSANWTPYYDINVPGMGQPIQLATKAKVGQTTGLDWNKVKLTLSTATPSNSKIAPLFDAWFLDFSYNHSTNKLRLKGASTLSLSQNNYFLQSDMILEESVVMGSVKDKKQEPMRYTVDGQFISEEEYYSISPDMIAHQETNNGVVMVTTKTMNDLVSRNEGELNMVYNIDLPYTITGNGKLQNIDLQSHAVSADFKHYSVPKLDTETFILAEISDWQKLGLLSGKANVTYDGTYVGETMIDASSISPKLTLTLGTDKRVTVKRVNLQDYSSKKTFGKDIKQEFTYKITVKNNQNKAIRMVLKDQYPLTKQKDIEVELHKDTTPATFVNEEVGVLNWEFELAAGESKDFKVMYTIKYPKDKPINF